MPTPVKMPRLGESVAEGTIGTWIKQVGDYVERDEALAEVITDKINAELPSPVSGRLTSILVNVDETVPVGTDIALIEESADVAAREQGYSPTGSAAPGPDAAPVQSIAQAATPRLEQSHTSDYTRVGLDAGYTHKAEEEERQRISPLAKRLAREHGINLNDIAGTGANGRVRKEDILAYVEQTAQRQPVRSTSMPQPVAAQMGSSSTITAPSSSLPAYTPTFPSFQPMPSSASTSSSSQPTQPISTIPRDTLAFPPFLPAQPTPSMNGGLDEEVIIPSRMRLAIAEHMVRSKRTSPHGRFQTP